MGRSIGWRSDGLQSKEASYFVVFNDRFGLPRRKQNSRQRYSRSMADCLGAL